MLRVALFPGGKSVRNKKLWISEINIIYWIVFSGACLIMWKSNTNRLVLIFWKMQKQIETQKEKKKSSYWIEKKAFGKVHFYSDVEN